MKESCGIPARLSVGRFSSTRDFSLSPVIEFLLAGLEDRVQPTGALSFFLAWPAGMQVPVQRPHLRVSPACGRHS